MIALYFFDDSIIRKNSSVLIIFRCLVWFIFPLVDITVVFHLFLQDLNFLNNSVILFSKILMHSLIGVSWGSDESSDSSCKTFQWVAGVVGSVTYLSNKGLLKKLKIFWRTRYLEWCHNFCFILCCFIKVFVWVLSCMSGDSSNLIC